MTLNDILTKSAEQMTDMERFSVFLRYADNPDYRDVVNKVIEKEEGLAVAAEVLTTISKDERERAIFRSRRIAMADAESNRVTIEKKTAKAIARNLLAMSCLLSKLLKQQDSQKKKLKPCVVPIKHTKPAKNNRSFDIHPLSC